MSGLTDGGSEAALREAGCAGDAAAALSRSLRWPVVCDAEAWSEQVLRRVSPLLQEHARRVWRRQMATLLAAAVATLPLSLLAGAYGIATAYGVLSAWLPEALATYLVVNYAVVALAVLGATYAMIPIAIDRSRDQLALVQPWEGVR